jgi:hypothetical protein
VGGEWLGIYNDRITFNPIAIFVTTQWFQPYAGNSIQQKVVIPKEV